MILSRIDPIADPSLPKELAGFRREQSTADQVVRLTQNIEEAYNNKHVCGAVFLDLTAAYDTVWHKGLLLKLSKCISCKYMTNFIMEPLCTRSYVLSTSASHKSKPHRLKNGVTQGSVLAPTLYNIC